MNSLEIEDVETSCTIQKYLNFFEKKASGQSMYSSASVYNTMTVLLGELLTTATWMRNFISQHPNYKQDSVVNDRITYDLMVACDRISKGETCAELTGALRSHTVRDIVTCPISLGTKRKSESEVPA